MTSRYAALSRADLAVLVPELLLCGHLIDRSGMTWVISELGRERMLEVAIDEWAAASPIYAKRMQRALGFEGTDVVTIFKGIQFDIGSPPQYMDFRFAVSSPVAGEFWLDHCGALMDVEPMGADYVHGMCWDIEDPTFDATALATNPNAAVRPVHRPPRASTDEHPHCRWTVTIDDSNPHPAPNQFLADNAASHAARLELDPVDPADDGRADYSGPLLADVDFAAFSRSALARVADEVVLQQHLLFRAFRLSLEAHLAGDVAAVRTVGTRQLTGIAGLTAERIHRALRLPKSPEGAMRALALHPVFNPAAYVDATFGERSLRVRPSKAHEDEVWLSRCGPHSVEPLQAMVRAVDPRFDVEVSGDDTAWELTVVEREQPADEAKEVVVTRFSGGAAFAFQPRTSLPVTVLR